MTKATRSATAAAPEAAVSGSRDTSRLTIALIAAGISLGYGVGTLNASLPGISALVGATVGQLNWLTSTQLLCTVIAVPIVGRMGDMFGLRRMLFVSVALTSLGAVLIAVAPTFAIMLVGRVMQGLIGGLFSLGPALVRNRIALKPGNLVIGASAGSTFIGMIIGLFVAASLASGGGTGTRAALLVAAVVYAVAAALVFLAPESAATARRSLDVRGTLFLIVALLAIVMGLREAELSGWAHWQTLCWLLGGVAVLIVWVRIESRTRTPLIDVRGLATRRVLPVAAIAFAFGAAQYGAVTAAVTFMASPADTVGYGLSMTSSQIALLFAPSVVLASLTAIGASRLASIIGSTATFTLGALLLTAGFVFMILFHDSVLTFGLAFGTMLAGQGVLQTMWPAELSAAAEASERGATTSVGQSLETLGGGLATAVFATVLGSMAIPGTDVPIETAYVWVWVACAGASVIIIPLAFLRRMSHLPA